jgi:protein SCO1/2
VIARMIRGNGGRRLLPPAPLLTAGIVLALLVMLGGCHNDSDEAAEAYGATNKADCLPAIKLLDQHNKPVVLSSFKGKAVLVNFIYTSCPGPCLTETLKMAKVADRVSQDLGSKVILLSVTVDPEHDGPAQLLQYAQKQGVERPGWLFLTGSPSAIDDVLKNFKLIRRREDDGSVDHIVGVFLLGADGRELREYNGEILSADSIETDINKAIARG